MRKTQEKSVKKIQENLIQEISQKFCSGNLVENSKNWRKKISDFFTKKNIKKFCEVIHRVIHSFHSQAKIKNKSFLYFNNDIILIDYKKAF